MENIPAISVIIPMYNVEKYIADCLESILNQTFQNFEVIVVDDCSTDNSPKVVKSYLEKFGGRLKLYRNAKNSDAGVSRNNGLMLSHGEYVYYMDSDDLLILTGLEKMYSTAKKFNAEVVNLSAYYKMTSDAMEATVVNNRNNRIFAKGTDEFLVDDDLMWRLQKPLTYRFYGSACFRLFNRDFLIENRLFFPENIRRLEDVVWKYGFLLCAKRIVHLACPLYFYRMVDGSKTRQRRELLEYVDYRFLPVINGLKWIEGILDKIDFFKKNPQYYYVIFEELTNDLVSRMLGYTQRRKWTAADIYRATRQEFGEKFGKYDVLIAELFSLIHAQQRETEKLKEQLKK